MTPYLIFIGAIIVVCLLCWIRVRQVNLFQKEAIEGDHCQFFIENERVQGTIIAADENEVAIWFNEKTYLRSRSEIYPV